MGVIIRKPALHLSPDTLTNKDIETIWRATGCINESNEQEFINGGKRYSTVDGYIKRKSGIGERRISYGGNNSFENGLYAAKEAIEINGIDPDEITHIVFASNKTDNEQLYPTAGHLISGHLGIKSRPEIYFLSNGCSSAVQGIVNVRNALLVNGKGKGIVIFSENITDFVDYGDKNAMLFGDAATAYIIEIADGLEGIISAVTGSDPDMNGALRMEYREGFKIIPAEMYRSRNMKNPIHASFVIEDGREIYVYRQVQNYVYMDGGAVRKWAAKASFDSIVAAVEKSRYKLSDLDVLIPHGANINIIQDTYGRLMDRCASKDETFKADMIHYLEKVGNPSGASIGISMRWGLDEGRIKDNNLMLLSVFGAGFSEASILSRYHEKKN